LIIFFLTQDWHPKDHCSFASNNPKSTVFTEIETSYGKQMMWPDHCVQGTPGAEFPKSLNTLPTDIVIKKGLNKIYDSYSGFWDNGKKSQTDMEKELKQRHVTEVYVCGLALDYCVYYTSLDAAHAGFKTMLLLDACRGINETSMHNAVIDMKKMGVKITSSTDIFRTRRLLSKLNWCAAKKK